MATCLSIQHVQIIYFFFLCVSPFSYPFLMTVTLFHNAILLLVIRSTHNFGSLEGVHRSDRLVLLVTLFFKKSDVSPNTLSYTFSFSHPDPNLSKMVHILRTGTLHRIEEPFSELRFSERIKNWAFYLKINILGFYNFTTFLIYTG